MTLKHGQLRADVAIDNCEVTCHVVHDGDVRDVPVIDVIKDASGADLSKDGESSSSGVVSSLRDARRAAREHERQARLHGKLTSIRFSDLIRARSSSSAALESGVDILKRGILHCVLGSKSQFDARNGRLRDLMPPLTTDCCQTFATLSAVILSSLVPSATMAECFCPSTVNYLLYISAWMHQLSVTSWPQGGVRPTVSDLDTCLHLRQFFPSKVNPDEFDVVFYNQAYKAKDLLLQLCAQGKRGRDSEGKYMPCGYVIVSGDYTVSVFAVEHGMGESSRSPYSQAWSLYICDSHGTQPWTYGKASITGVTFGIPAKVSVDVLAPSPPRTEHVVEDVEHAGTPSTSTYATQPHFSHVPHKSSTPAVLNVDEGLTYFSTLLFTLLEEHRRVAPSGAASSSVEISLSSSPTVLRASTNATTPESASSHSRVSPKDVILSESICVDHGSNDVIYTVDGRRTKDSINDNDGNSQASLCSQQVPYMTWTPLRRRRSLAFTAEELKAIIDEQWVPAVLADASIQQQAKRFSFAPLECFWNLRSISGTV